MEKYNNNDSVNQKFKTKTKKHQSIHLKFDKLVAKKLMQ